MTLFIVVVTAFISIMAFNNTSVFRKLLLNPYLVNSERQYYRLLTHGFIHADWLHLIVNMFVLYSFGNAIESQFDYLAYKGYMIYPKVWFLLLYILGIVFASLPTLYKRRNDSSYNCVGASGAVSAVVFCHIFFAPFQKIYFYLAIPLPGIVFGIAYLIYSQYMSKREMDNINHDAHFTGAVFGFLFPLFIDYHLIDYFIIQITNFRF